MPRADILVVGVDSTTGWRAATGELVRALRRAGARVAVATTGSLRRVRTFALTDLVEARAARRVAQAAIVTHNPGAVIYCSITAALLWPRAGAVWLDSVAAENRPGRHGIWQRVVEPRRLERAPVVLVMSASALNGVSTRAPIEVLPVPVEPSGRVEGDRSIAAVTYAGNPEKKRLDHVLHAWAHARRGDEKLVVAGLDGVEAAPGVEVAGRLTPAEYRALLRKARAFVAAPSREDFGIAPLEALADGCQLVTAPAPGPYPARDIAQRIDPRLVSDDLPTAIRAALDDPVPDYADRAAELLVPFSRAVVDETVAERVLPRLLPG